MQDLQLTFVDIRLSILLAHSYYNHNRWYNSTAAFSVSLSAIPLFGEIYNSIKTSSRDFKTLKESINAINMDTNKNQDQKCSEAQVSLYNYLISGAGENNQYSHKFNVVMCLYRKGAYYYEKTTEQEAKVAIENTIEKLARLPSVQQYLAHKDQEQLINFDSGNLKIYSKHNEL